ncbi:MAG: FAD-dependent oxidoreductase [Clostridia bacterium]|nr:FAD-dependent oxidoreductase [Clostridia bacterium]
MYDITVIGAGPAGLTAAVYARRAGKNVLVIEKSTFGGQITFSPKIENYPGFEEISGNELADKMVSQALGLGAEIEMAEVTSVSRSDSGSFVTVADGNEYESRAVVIAAGADHRRLGLEGEDALIGNGISFCAVCDGAFYKGLKVAVIGGGNSALVEANLLADICSEVIVVQNLAFLTAEKSSVDALLSHSNVSVVYSTVVDEYIAYENGSLKALSLKNTADDTVSYLEVDGCFVAIGLKPENAPFSGVAALDKWGYIDAGEDTVPSGAAGGIFAAGDCRTKRIRQISTACADGAVAALAACAYVDSLSGRE